MPKAEIKKSKYISYLLRFVVAGGALYLAFRGEDVKKVTTILLGLNLWIFAAALGIYIISQLIFVSRWYLLLYVQGIKIGFLPALRLHFLGLFYNNCLPSAVGGDLLRAWYVTKHTDKKFQAAMSVFVDRAIGLAGTIIMAFFCWWFLPAAGRKERLGAADNINFLQSLVEYRWVLSGVAVVLVIAFVVFVLSDRGRVLLRNGLVFVQVHGMVMLRKGHDAIRIYYNRKLALFWAMLLTFACQGVFIIGMWLLGREIGVTAHLKYYLIFFPISWVLGTLPISVGGAGIMEWWLKDIFVRVCAVPGEYALALALCQRLLWLVGSLPGAVIHLVGAHLPKDFFVDYKKPIN